MYAIHECKTCDHEFGSQHAANQHMGALDHWGPSYECDTCDREFDTQHAANQHMDALGHREPQFECDTCSRKFSTQQSANQHMDAVNHRQRNCCTACNKVFQNENSLKMHLNSSTHRGKNVACPFCKMALTSASGLSHHLETGSCTKALNINHKTVFNTVSQGDPGGLLTNKLLTHPESEIQNIATTATRNGYSFECYLCHHIYDTIRALNQHLNSPAHSEKLYHCPNRSCNREFGRLASLFNYLESESCGFVRFETIQDSVQNIMTGRQKLVGFV